MESASAVYTSKPILPFPVSSLGAIVWPVPSRLKLAVGTKGELFQNQIIQRAIWFLSRAVLKASFDVDWAGDEHNGKVCAALLSLWQCVFKTFWCFFFFLPSCCGILGVCGMQVGSPRALWDYGSLAYGLWLVHQELLRDQVTFVLNLRWLAQKKSLSKTAIQSCLYVPNEFHESSRHQKELLDMSMKERGWKLQEVENRQKKSHLSTKINYKYTINVCPFPST